MVAARAQAACGKGIPDGAASDKEGLRRGCRVAAPGARRVRLPAAQRAADAAELFVVVERECVVDDFGRPTGLPSQRQKGAAARFIRFVRVPHRTGNGKLDSFLSPGGP